MSDETSKVLPERYHAMTTEQAEALSPAELMDLFRSVSWPALVEFRLELRRTPLSGLITMMMNLGKANGPLRPLYDKLEEDDSLDAADKELVVGAAAAAIADEIDFVVPR